jgi:hypothetical protein
MKGQTSFEEIAQSDRAGSFMGELWAMLTQKKKYWLIPIVVVLLMLGVLVFLSGTAAAPFIYTLF